MKIKIFILTFFLSCLIQAKEVLYSYSGWLVNESYIFAIDENKKTMLFYGWDQPNKLEICNSDSKYYCFFSRRLAFSVPKNLSEDQKHWKCKNVLFEIVKKNISISLLGKSMSNLIMIKSPASATLSGQQMKMPTYWLYSNKYGVVGFGYLKNSLVYWLRDKKGFGYSTEKIKGVAH